MGNRARTGRNIRIIGAFQPDYPRNQVIISGLERIGFTVTSTNLSRKQGTIGKVIELLRRRSELRSSDMLLIPAFNQLLAPFIWFLAKIFRKPVILDYMVGLTDAGVEERDENSILKTALYPLIDRFNIACIPSFTDTAAHISAFQRLLTVQSMTMNVIPVGVYDPWFHQYPMPIQSPLIIQYFGNYLPFHGVDIIVDAIAEFRGDKRVQFEIIGKGQTYNTVVAQAAGLNLDNITFVNPIAPDKLPERVAQSTICLGVFGARPKTDYVVPNKVYQCMAIGRPVITAESTALIEMFTPGEHLITVKPGDSHALAEAIHLLVEDEVARARLANAAANRIASSFLPQHIGSLLKPILEQITDISA